VLFVFVFLFLLFYFFFRKALYCAKDFLEEMDMVRMWTSNCLTGKMYRCNFLSLLYNSPTITNDSN